MTYDFGLIWDMRDITLRATQGCPVEVALTVVGGCWKLTIIQCLLAKTHRYGELKKALGSVSDRTLTRQLRELEADGLIVRVVFPEVPPKVEYSLTPIGRSLENIVQSIDVWGQQWLATQTEHAKS